MQLNQVDLAKTTKFQASPTAFEDRMTLRLVNAFDSGRKNE